MVLAAGVLALAGCAPQPVGQPDDQLPVVAPATQETPTTPPAPVPTTEAAQPAPPPAPRSCRAGDLELSHGQFRQVELGAGGELVTAGKDFQLRHIGAETCTLQGWVTMAVVGESVVNVCVGEQTDPSCGQPGDRTTVRDVPNGRLSGNAALVTLAPGQQTVFTATWPHCLLMAWEIQVRVPGDETPIVLGAGQLPNCPSTVFNLTPIGTTL